MRSPDYVHRKRRSIQLSEFKCPESIKQGSFVLDQSVEVMVPNVNERGETKDEVLLVSQNVIMNELYARLLSTISVEIKGLKKGTTAKF